ncbi:hypothetical protein Vretimale_13486 [Volvox reticuliferus]|uniref:Uncharacterized protein n=1 Tax=Volvox reticuliferus TaxID=1737510 RepID=A0A8J4GLM1_9CHLO|nr:hypothetical protein Vretimale_13486 [Volvox reticuliferus]
MVPAHKLTSCLCFRTPKNMLIYAKFSTGRHVGLKSCTTPSYIGVGGCPGKSDMRTGTNEWKKSSMQDTTQACLCPGGNDDGRDGAGRHNFKGSCSGGGSNNGGRHRNFNAGGGDDFGDKLWRCSRPALLGAFVLVTASGAFPSPSCATPGSFFSSANSAFHTPVLGDSGKMSQLSSSAPASGGAGLRDSLDRASMDHNSISSTSTSPTRRRSKAMHVFCKGSTLVVPLTGSEMKTGEIPLPRTLLPWQRRRIVEAPIELSEREARMLASRQNRVRDSLLVQ